MIKELFTIIILSGIMLITAFWGMGRYERHECLVWASEKVKYENAGWFASDWQKAQCSNYNITL